MSSITVHTRGDSYTYDGTVEVAMAPNGALIVQEVGPNIAKGGGDKAEIKAMFPPGDWVRVHCE